jgi:quercetin dioxygenase-like cupin family protein
VSAVVVIPARGGEIVGRSPGRRVEILSDHATLAATWSHFGPRREGADLHVHRDHADLFYILDGEFTLRLGPDDEPLVVSAGKLVYVPPLVVHGFRNGSDADVRYLNFHAPGMHFAEYLRALRDGLQFSYDQHDPPADGGRSTHLVSVGETVAVEHLSVPERRLGRGAVEEREPTPRLRSLYVLEGAAVGSWIQIPPGVSHSLRAGPPATRYLEVLTPPGPG